jgi:hypothetical protein
MPSPVVAHALGYHPVTTARLAPQAATGLIIARGTRLARDDFACFIHHGTGTAAIDWEAAILGCL